jgi:hypothetical protein
MFKLKLLLLLLVAIVMAACSESSTEPENSNFSLSFAVEQELPKLNVETMELTSVKILIRSLKLNAAQDDDTNIRTDPFVIELSLDGSVNSVAVADVPDQSYDKVKFEIHKPDSLETPPDPEFLDEANRYSVVVQGLSDGVGFTYKSIKSVHQIIHLDDPVSLDENGMLNVTLIVNPYDWFTDNGSFIDPTISRNSKIIDDLMKDSFNRGFRDNNKDGIPD